MADSDLEKTESATPKRVGEARKEGQVPRSREWTTFTVVLSGGASLLIMSESLMEGSKRILERGLIIERWQWMDNAFLTHQFFDLSVLSLFIFLPFIAVIFFVALVSPIVIGGWNFSGTAFAPNFSRLSFAAGLSRMFSTQGLVELGKALLKTFFIGGVGLWLMWNKKEPILGLMGQAPPVAMHHLGALLSSTFYYLMLALFLIVVIDVPYQLWSYAKSLRMTKEEIKQEGRESEGDPQIKARIRAMQREAARKRMMGEVPKANVIVTNPTHFAVAIRYEENAARAPLVIAKGANLVAERICEIATENKVPILRAPPLARALYTHTEIGEEIPSALFTAVAQVLAYIYQLKAYFTQADQTVRPELPRTLAVPKELDPQSDSTEAASIHEATELVTL